MTEGKKATDLLNDIIANQQIILKYLQNIDYTNKLIHNRLSNTSPAVVQKIEPPQVADVKIISTKSSLQIALEADEQEQMNDELMVEVNSDGKLRTQRSENVIKKIPVQQRIVYADGKNIYMANVEIFNSQGVSVKKTRTNQIGKYLAAIPSGEYTVTVTKAATTLKPKVDLNYSISIPNSDTQIELEPKQG